MLYQMQHTQVMQQRGAIREALKKADENNLIEQIKTDVIKLEEKLDKNSGSALDKLEKDFESLSPESKTKLNDAGYGARIKALRAKFAALSLQPVEDEKDDPAAKHYTREVHFYIQMEHLQWYLQKRSILKLRLLKRMVRQHIQFPLRKVA